jgi:large repetitive protein
VPAPQAWIVHGPGSRYVVAFADNAAGVTHYCQVDGGAWTACASPKAYTSLSGKRHVIAVKSVAADGRESAVRTLLVNPGAARSRYTFTFAQTVTGASYSCRIDHGKFAKCSSGKAFRGLKPGRHVFTVKSVDADGHVSIAPKITFTVAKKAA